MNQLSCSVPCLSQTFTVITFPWFFLCDSCLVNIAAEIHYLIFSVLFFSSPLGECQSTTCGLFQSAVNSRWVPLHCLFLAHRCMILPSGLKRLPLFTVICCDFDQREKASCPERRASCSGVPWRSLLCSSGCCWFETYGDKSKCHWRLRALVFVRRSWCSLSRLDLISVDSVSFLGDEWLLYLGNLYLCFFQQYLLFSGVLSSF